MDIRQFRQISMIAQGEFARLLTAPPREKTQIFREIFDTAFFERFAALLRGKTQELYREIQMYEHKMTEDIDSFDCHDDEWRLLTTPDNVSPEAVCAYLTKKEETELANKKALNEALHKTEQKLEQTGEALKEVSGLLKAQAEAEQLGQKLEQMAPVYEKRAEIEKWLLLAGERKNGADAWRAAESSAAEADRQLKRMQETYLRLQRMAAEKRSAYEHANAAYRSAVIGITASMLEEGKPCPVCGSTEHPHIAEQDAGVPDEAALTAMRKERDAAEKQLTDAYGAAAAQKKESEHRQELLQEKEAAFMQLEAQYLQVTEECGRAVLDSLLRRAQLTSCSAPEKAWQEREWSESELRRMRERFETAVRSCQEAQTLLAVKEGAVRESLKKLRIDTPEQADARKGELTQERDALLLRKKELLDSQKRNYALLQNAGRIRRSLEEKLERMQSLKEEYGIVKDLDNLTSGNNARRLVFEQYVLAGYFEEILHAANRRLEQMTSGRYALHRVEEVGDGRSKDNLEIRVLDHYTGRYRSVKTLSGGETFKASLSLALGLSDVIQRRSGGIAVDCLFIDEGFGALDDESLEQACHTLKTLVSGSCMIGIISHVPQLKEQIENQLVIRRTNHGSYCGDT